MRGLPRGECSHIDSIGGSFPGDFVHEAALSENDFQFVEQRRADFVARDRTCIEYQLPDFQFDVPAIQIQPSISDSISGLLLFAYSLRAACSRCLILTG